MAQATASPPAIAGGIGGSLSRSDWRLIARAARQGWRPALVTRQMIVAELREVLQVDESPTRLVLAAARAALAMDTANLERIPRGD